MSKELEALEEIGTTLMFINKNTLESKPLKEVMPNYYNTIKQSLIKSQENEKVLEILFKKQVDINLFITIIPFNKSIEELTRAYNQCFIERCRLTIEETKLLKEVLGNE